MKFAYWEVDVPNGGAVRVYLSGQEANVRVMDWSNFTSYKAGRQHHYYGGHYRQSPVIITPPSSGHWYVVVDLGGYSGNVSASVSVI